VRAVHLRQSPPRGRAAACAACDRRDDDSCAAVGKPTTNFADLRIRICETGAPPTGAAEGSPPRRPHARDPSLAPAVPGAGSGPRCHPPESAASVRAAPAAPPFRKALVCRAPRPALHSPGDAGGELPGDQCLVLHLVVSGKQRGDTNGQAAVQRHAGRHPGPCMDSRNKEATSREHKISTGNTTQRNKTQHNTTQRNTTQHDATQRDTAQHNTTQAVQTVEQRARAHHHARAHPHPHAYASAQSCPMYTY
jgi:hypothetical protein